MSSKNRFTTSDVKAMVRDIRSSILGQRVANLYDLSDKIYLFKFAVPGVAKKIFLLVESGMRFHTTRYNRVKNDMPSPFAMKLRKHIRLKRLEDIRQLGSDRVVDLKFGSGDAICHIILELYASGNIVLTDGNYEIIALLRSHKFEEDIAVQVGEIYPIAFTTTVAPTSDGTSITSMSSSDFVAWARERYQEMIIANEEQQKQKIEAEKVVTVATATTGKGGKNTQTSNAVAGKKQRIKKMNMRQLLLCKESGVALFGPEILDHCLLTAGFNPTTKVEEFLKTMDDSDGGLDSSGGDAVRQLLQGLLDMAPGLLSLLDTPGQPGYILLKPNNNISEKSVKDNEKAEDGVTDGDKHGDYFDFVPRLYRQHDDEVFREFSSFDEAVDEYFCKVEEQRLQHHASAAEEAAKKKVKKVRDEMKSQLQGLADTQLRMEKAACLTEAFAEEVDKACLVINSALGAGISWEDISTMVATETAAGNPIASLIAKLRLDRNRVIIRLPDILADSDSDDEEELGSDDESQQSSSFMAKKAYVDVDLDLSLSAYANASKLYSQRKVAKSKEQKTAVAAERAIKAVELSSSKALVKQQVKRNLQAQRKVHWFEKFNWFISSEGYLVLSGRDAQQNEQLVKKYLRAGDAYVHADMHGASSCVVRCKVKKDPVTGSETPLPISPIALNEAGTMTICRSGAWSVKVVMSAWWVNASQVSKTAPTGEYLSTGSFMIYGKKNYLPPTSLEMGFGILFRLEDGSVSRHQGEREDKSIHHNEEDESVSESVEEHDKGGLALKRVPGNKPSTDNISENVRREDDVEKKETKKVRKTRAQRKAERELALEEEDESDEEKVEEDGDGDEEEKEDVEKEKEGVSDDDDVTPPSPSFQSSSEEVTSLNQSEDSGSSTSAAVTTTTAISETAEVTSKEDVQVKPTAGRGKAKLTPYQRKMLKKGKTLEEIEQMQIQKQQEKDEQAVLALKEKDIAEEDADNDDAGNVKKDSTTATEASNISTNGKKKKKLSKKKARKYADQDEEDVRLAMRALGHGKQGADGRDDDTATAAAATKSSEEKSKRQAKAGIHLLQANRATAMAALSDEVRTQFSKLVTKKLLREDEVDPFELTTLSTFTPAEGLEILALFDCDNCSGIGNKSGFLAGIMRRFSKTKETNMIKRRQEEAQLQKQQMEKQESDEKEEDEDLGLESAAGGISRRERKKIEAQEIQLILQEEGVLDEQEGRLADELHKLTGQPVASDTLLYAVPVCGPFSALKNLKYKVKLTPGTIKKGKACKNAVEVFVNSKNYALPVNTATSSDGGSSGSSVDAVSSQIEATNKERALIKGLTDPEMVAIMIGDVKLSMPGLYSTLKKKKEASKKGKKK